MTTNDNATHQPSPEFLAAARRIKACPCRILSKRPCKACREDARAASSGVAIPRKAAQ